MCKYWTEDYAFSCLHKDISDTLQAWVAAFVGLVASLIIIISPHPSSVDIGHIMRHVTAG